MINNDDDDSSSSSSKKKKKKKKKKNDIERRKSPRTVSNTYAQVARAQLCANHVQHIERLSRATRRVTCHAVLRDSSAIKFDRV